MIVVGALSTNGQSLVVHHVVDNPWCVSQDNAVRDTAQGSCLLLSGVRDDHRLRRWQRKDGGDQRQRKKGLSEHCCKEQGAGKTSV